jgi:hypothetical protein
MAPAATAIGCRPLSTAVTTRLRGSAIRSNVCADSTRSRSEAQVALDAFVVEYKTDGSLDPPAAVGLGIKIHNGHSREPHQAAGRRPATRASVRRWRLDQSSAALAAAASVPGSSDRCVARTLKGRKRHRRRAAVSNVAPILRAGLRVGQDRGHSVPPGNPERFTC